MFTDKQKEKLKVSWGDKADSLACYAEVRIFDPLSRWQCYIYAMNPADENDIACIIAGESLEICDWQVSEIQKAYNAEGESPVIDTEYRPMRAAELFKKLSGAYETARN